MRVLSALVCSALAGCFLLVASNAQAQAPFTTQKERLCLENWMTVTLQRLNGYNGTADFNAGKPYRFTRFGFIVNKVSRSNYEPDDWARFGANRDTYMWNYYSDETPFPYWKNPNYRGARVPGLRYHVKTCLGGAGSTTGTTTGTVPATGTGTGTGTGTTTTGPTGIAIGPNAACPTTLSPLRSFPNVILGCRCGAVPGTGPVWGSGPYTFDSNMCRAAQHAGVIGAAGGPIWVTVGPKQTLYTGTARNGITTTDYGAYGPSMVFLGAGAPAMTDTQVRACPGTMKNQPNQVKCHCAPSRFSSGGIWGTGVYTFDSNVCNAAIHAGVVSRSGGTVTVRQSPGRSSYQGSTRNGITSQKYGAWNGSFEFVH